MQRQFTVENIVFLEGNRKETEPFTTSDVVAKWTGNNYRSIQRIIEKQLPRLERFGRVRFEITPLQTRGGMQNHKVYYLNEPQATLLVTFLKNTDIVADFKTELVRQFYAIREELSGWQMRRLELKPIRRDMTDIIQEVDSSRWAYKKYTDLAYKSSVGKNAAQLRKERNAPRKAIAVDYMTSGELSAVAKRTNQIGVLLEIGMNYEQVKAIVLEHKLVGAIETIKSNKTQDFASESLALGEQKGA